MGVSGCQRRRVSQWGGGPCWQSGGVILRAGRLGSATVCQRGLLCGGAVLCPRVSLQAAGLSIC